VDDALAAARRPHAVLDTASRRVKGQKIERLLGPLPDRTPLRVLEVGCGGGGISAFFGAQQGFDVTAVDVVDQRQVHDGYAFVCVDGVVLPFDDGVFDVVLSNHVVEHVGDQSLQARHFHELARVLRPDGVGYVAVPNRWAVIEPHFRVPFLSWPPRRLRTPYLMAVRGTHYDCEPLGPTELDRLLDAAGLVSESIEDEALQAMLDLGELHGIAAACVQHCPRWFRRALRPAMPTLIRRVHHA
jgi:SAM-dependent methyltransferase